MQHLLRGLMVGSLGLLLVNCSSDGADEYEGETTDDVSSHFVAGAAPAPASYTPGTSGGVAVTEQGALSYSLPIFTAPAAGGMAPALSLEYSSQAGPGLLGVGGSLRGLSAIGRCPRTIANDGESSEIEFDDSDRFCLDGERLVAVTGVYGAANTEYRTEIDSLTRVVSYGRQGNGPASFRAWLKSGQILDFGTTASSRIEASGGSTTVRTWAVAKIADRFSNTMDVAYSENNTTGAFVPTKISFGANSAQATAHTGSVTFSYEAAAAPTHYIGGTKVSMPWRLSRVLSYAGATVVRDYRLEYVTAEPLDQSRLVAITECDQGNVCLKPTRFEWIDAKPLAGTPATWGSGVTEPPLLGDFNGDGKTDIAKVVLPNVHVALSSGAAFGAWTVWGSVQGATGDRAHVGDINGDGKADLFFTTLPRGNPYPPAVVALLSSGAAFSNTTLVSSPWWFGNTNLTSVFPTDVNNDGRSDLVSIQFYPSTTVVAWISKAVGMTIPPSPIEQITYNSPMTVLGASDVTGDGKSELTAIMNGKVVLKPFDGDLVTTTLPLAVSDSLRLADVNGDGKEDIVQLGTYTTDSKAWLATGRGFATTATSLGTGFSKDETLIDMNGDGRPDMVRVSGTDVSAWVVLAANAGFTSNWQRFIVDRKGLKASFGDFNGDGYPDILQNDAGSARVTLNTTGLHNVVKAVVDARGVRSDVTYIQPSRGGSAYERSSAAVAYPQQATAPTLPVVSRLATPNGAGGTRARTFKYVGARVNLDGRGFAGFERVIQRDFNYASTTAHLETETSYRTAFPYVGLVSSQTRSYVDGSTRRLLSEISNTWSNAGTATRALPVQTKTVEKSWDLNGAPLPTVTTSAGTFDLGTPTLIVSDVGGYKKTTRLTYTHDLAGWKLHRLARAAVTHEAPAAANLPAITRTTAYGYDATTGALTSETVEPDNNAELERSTTYGYDEFGNRDVVTISGPTFVKRTSRTIYDATGRFAVTQRNALGHETKTVYDARFGLPLSITDPNGLITKATYDGFGRKASETSPDGIVTQYRTTLCDATCPTGASYLSTTTRTAAAKSTVYFDQLGRDIRAVTESAFDGQEVIVDKVRDASGRVTRTSAPRFEADTTIRWSTTAYDVLDRPISATDFMNRTSKVTYDGLTTTSESALGQISTSTKNAQGRIVEVEESGVKTTYRHDAIGDRIATVDAKGTIARVSYDTLGRKKTSVDPTSGTWRYTYDGLGQLASQTDGKGQITTMTYDLLGRLTKRIAPDATAVFTYDDVNGLGKIATEQSSGTIGTTMRGYAYDAKSRVVASDLVDLSAPNLPAFVTKSTYDTLGRESTVTYPNGVVIRTVYNTRSFPVRLERVVGTTATSLWEARAVDARGQVTQELRGNGLTTTRTFDPLGRLTRASTPTKSGLACIPVSCSPDLETYDPETKTDATGCALNPDAGQHQRLPAGCTDETPQDYSAAYDEIGRLKQRVDKVAGLSETFTYDELDRLKTVTGKTNKAFAYDDVGNITSKSDVGTYAYGTRPYAVESITGPAATTFKYDLNGNMLSGAGRTLTWTSANKPRHVTRGAAFSTFDYDAKHQRVRQTDHTGAKTYYGAGGLEHVMHANGTQTIRLGISSPAGLLAQIVTRVSATGTKSESTSYLLTDHLGSVQVVASATGAVLQRLSYDAHGLPRFTNGVDADVGEIVARTTRGFTGHEMLGALGLVNMNARLYDPLLGRFLSADDVIQFPFSTQGQNRYSYTDNHPLSAVDPSGNGWFSGMFRVFAAIAIACILPQLSAFMLQMESLAIAMGIHIKIVTGVVVGAISGIVSTGTLKGAILGGVSGGLFAGAGFIGKAGSVLRHFAHGVAGAVSASLSGTSTRAGFLSATFRALGGQIIERVPDEVPARVAAAAAVGGVGSVIGGGKFENGAVTGAFGELFNHQSDKLTARGGGMCRRSDWEVRPKYDGPEMTAWDGRADQRGANFQAQFALVQAKSLAFLAEAIASFPDAMVDIAIDFGLVPDEGGPLMAAFGAARGRPFTKAEQDLIEIANSYQRGLIPRQDANVLVDLAKEIGLDKQGRVDIHEFSVRATDPLWKSPHVHFPGLKEHGIPIADGPFSPYVTIRR